MSDLIKYGDKILIGVISALAPIIIGIVGYWKLKRAGIDKSNYFLVEDNVRLRADLFAEVAKLRTEVTESQNRERQLQIQNGQQAAKIATLETQQEAQRQDMADMKANHREKVNEFRSKIRKLHEQLASARK